MSTKDGILSHRTFVFDSFSIPVSEFYSLLEAMLKERAIPGAKTSRVFLREGGFLGTKRQYLRVRRSSEVFDISAAAFGESFMVSYFLRELPTHIALKIFLGFIFLWLIVGKLPDPACRRIYRTAARRPRKGAFDILRTAPLSRSKDLMRPDLVAALRKNHRLG